MSAPAPQAACLDDTVVALFVEGGIAVADRPGIERHLDTCAGCREMVAAVARQDSRAPETRDERGGRHARTRDAELAPEQHIGRYLIVQAVGAGAMGTVYLARDPSLDRRVAIKVLRSSALDRDAQARLLREAQAMARVDHANVVAVHDIGEHDGQVFLALEYVGGGNLRKWLGARRSWQEVTQVFLAAARGLAAVHDAGLVHRDFKPDNVLLAEDGSVHVGDFGLVSAAATLPATEPDMEISDLEVSLTATGVVVGTPAYMAPEQFLGQVVDSRSDQFAFCAALFEGLYGVRPFAGDDVQSLSSAVLAGTQRAATRRDVPRPLHAVVRRGLSRNAADRFASMADVIAALERVTGRRRRVAVVAAAVAGALAIAAVIAIVATRRPHAAGAAVAGPGPCAGAERELAGIWDDARRAAAGERFGQAGVAYAADSWQLAAGRLDTYAAAWTRSQREACEATRVRRTQTEAVMAARLSCLGDRKARLRAVTDELVAPAGDAPAIVAGAQRLIGELPTVESCDQLTEPEVAQAPPAARWNEIAPIEDSLRRLEAVAGIVGGGAIPEARTLVTSADATGFAPLRARARRLLGILLFADGEGGEAAVPEAEAVLQVAVQLADEGRDDKTRAELLGVLASAAVSRNDWVASRRHLDAWRAALTRVGVDPEADLQFVMSRGILQMFEGKIDGLAADAERIDRLLADGRSDFAERAEWLVLFGLAATEYAAPAVQLEHAQPLFERARRELGPLHPQTLELQMLVADALYYLHRYAEAESIVQDVLTHQDAPGYDMGDDRVVLGAIYRETGRFAEAAAQFTAEAADPETDQPQLDYQNGLLAFERGRPAEAIALYRRAQDGLATWLPADHPFMAQMWSARAIAERRRGHYRVGLDDAHEADAILSAMQGESHRHAEALAEVGLNAAALGQRQVALDALEAAIVASDRGSILTPHLAEVWVGLATLIAETDPVRARALAHTAATALEAVPTPWGRRVAADAAALIARLTPR